ncbi:MAG: TetR/AcrR family transcriptional regulator [Alkalilacustris sp.]
MRAEILREATELLVNHGYHGFHFGELARRLSCTRGAIHYHFGTKQELVEEVILDYVRATEADFSHIWRDPHSTLTDKILLTRDYNFARYRKFNPTEATAHPWSLINQMRGARALLSPRALQALKGFGPAVDACVREAIALAKGKGELRSDAPVDDITLQIVSIINSAGPITQDSGSFARLDRLYRASARIIAHAYGVGDDRGQDPATAG